MKLLKRLVLLVILACIAYAIRASAADPVHFTITNNTGVNFTNVTVTDQKGRRAGPNIGKGEVVYCPTNSEFACAFSGMPVDTVTLTTHNKSKTNNLFTIK